MPSLRTRQPVNYNETHLQAQAEADDGAFAQAQGLLKYTRQGVDNTKETKHRLEHVPDPSRSDSEVESDCESMSEDEHSRRKPAARPPNSRATRGARKSYREASMSDQDDLSEGQRTKLRAAGLEDESGDHDAMSTSEGEVEGTATDAEAGKCDAIEIDDSAGSGEEEEQAEKKRQPAQRRVPARQRAKSSQKSQTAQQPTRRQPRRQAAASTFQEGPASSEDNASEDEEDGSSSGSEEVAVDELPLRKRAESIKEAPPAQRKGKSTTKQQSVQVKAAKAKPARNAQTIDESSEEELEESIEEDKSTPLGEIEKVVDVRETAEGKEEYFVKFKGFSYRNARWLPEAVAFGEKPALLRNFVQKRAHNEEEEDADMVNGVHPDWLRVHRVIAKKQTVRDAQFLTKWHGLGYSDATWESEADLKDDQEHIELYRRRSKLSLPRPQPTTGFKLPEFQNGRKLRSYQEASLEWMAGNWKISRSCILGDEMGLGKTAQSIAVLELLRQQLGHRGPFLIIAPLTTLHHWEREINTWTPMNVVQYSGSAEDRKIIREHEFFFNGEKKFRKHTKFEVLLASYETVLRDKKEFQAITWEVVIVDEAHRLKSTVAATRDAIHNCNKHFTLLLTGTPVQNNVQELFGLLNLLDRVTFPSLEGFIEQFGGKDAPPTVDQIQALQEALRPLLLRRMKEDVEDLPEKEEVIVWVRLTTQQHAYYKAIYSKQVSTLLAGAMSKNMPNLRNLAMELRKVCCHPWLCNGLEDDMMMKRHQSSGANPADTLDALVHSSGKMLLLHKLLPKLRGEGRKVLIFSQFKIMLDVLEDYLRMSGMPLERIDGSVGQRDRQVAIDRFSKGEADSFVFLLSTRAGGQGITLTAADTVIIYDSDWNPQNDLQAVARSHRIGQSKDVTIYRLISKDTYEESVFQCSSKKYGLDEAILGNMQSSGDPEQDHRRIADLLKNGAHTLHHENEAHHEDAKFEQESIDAILNGRTEKRQLGSRKGNTFSTASFAFQDAEGKEGERDFWSNIMPEAIAAHDQQVLEAAKPQDIRPRRRKQISYNEDRLQKGTAAQEKTEPESDYAGGSSDGSTSADEATPAKERVKRWTKKELKSFEDSFIGLGEGRTRDAMVAAGLQERALEECHAVEQSLVAIIDRAAVMMQVVDLNKKADELNRAAEYREGVALAAAEGIQKDIDRHEATEARSKSDAMQARLQQAQSTAAEQNLLPCGSEARDIDVLLKDVNVPKAAQQAMASKEAVVRLMAKARKYQAQLEERRLLQQLLAGMTNGEQDSLMRFKALLKAQKLSGYMPQWWTKHEDKSLLANNLASGGTAYSARKNAEEWLVILAMQVTERAAADAGMPSPTEPASGSAGAAARPMDVDASGADVAGNAQPVQHGPAAPSTTRSWDILEHFTNMDEDLRKRLIRLVADRLRQLCKGLVVLAKKPTPRAAPPEPRPSTEEPMADVAGPDRRQEASPPEPRRTPLQLHAATDSGETLAKRKAAMLGSRSGAGEVNQKQRPNEPAAVEPAPPAKQSTHDAACSGPPAIPLDDDSDVEMIDKENPAGDRKAVTASRQVLSPSKQHRTANAGPSPSIPSVKEQSHSLSGFHLSDTGPSTKGKKNVAAAVAKRSMKQPKLPFGPKSTKSAEIEQPELAV
ncbi:hypothetical protein WJX74_002180 [Apatococcus lobatus]|uniref:Uncharacterized protein n=1 Tax=Apatococcus lobatus TaxID=904363 RepID=A0AAW1RPJ2_9CHLO